MAGIRLLCGCFYPTDPNEVREPPAHRVNSQKCHDDEICILLLGRNDVGKTTIIRNLCMNYGMCDELYRPLPDPCAGDFLKEKARPLVFFNLLQNFSQLVAVCLKEGYTFDDTATAQLAEGFLESARTNSELLSFSADVKESILKLWSDSAIQQTYASRRQHRITGNLKYFIENIERIAESEYLPTANDLLRIRFNTTESNQQRFKMDGYKYCMTDVGGTTSHRSGWPSIIHHFCDELLRAKSAAKVVIFVASLADYNQELLPCGSTSSDNINVRHNRPNTDMDESLSLFRLLINSERLKGKKIMLFLNMPDIFESRLSQFHDFRAVYPDADTDDDPAIAKQYIRGLFESEVRCSRFRRSEVLNTVIITATDKAVMKAVFNVTKEQIISEIVRDYTGCPQQTA